LEVPSTIYRCCVDREKKEERKTEREKGGRKEKREKNRTREGRERRRRKEADGGRREITNMQGYSHDLIAISYFQQAPFSSFLPSRAQLFSILLLGFISEIGSRISCMLVSGVDFGSIW
jgi:hypothetical protein